MDKIVYDPLLMDEIASLYSDAAAKASDIIVKIDDAQNCFLSNYVGGATVIADELLGKLKEHTGILKDCCLSTGSYITLCKEEMVRQDSVLIGKPGENGRW